jgi:hypothetical protein
VSRNRTGGSAETFSGAGPTEVQPANSEAHRPIASDLLRTAPSPNCPRTYINYW